MFFKNEYVKKKSRVATIIENSNGKFLFIKEIEDDYLILPSEKRR